MINKDIFFEYLDELYSDAHCELNYKSDYQLLIAIMLSAQTTDKAVNKATAILFSKYDSLKKLADADICDIEKCISFLGMYKNKAKNVKGIAHTIYYEYGGVVPKDPDILMSLPGVGNKTKNCYLAEMYNEPLLAVDTHVQRISKRLGIVKENDSVEAIEKKLMRYIPKEKVNKVNHQIIWFGRYFCKAIKPNCKECKIKASCKERY